MNVIIGGIKMKYSGMGGTYLNSIYYFFLGNIKISCVNYTDHPGFVSL
jgi:hypothetical protein